MAGESIGSGQRIKNMSDSNKVSDLNWVEKMKTLDKEQFGYLLASINQEKLTRKQQAALAKLAGSSGGGGGGRGGGSSSGKSTSSATETGTVNNVGDVELYNELKKTNPAAAEAFLSAYEGSGFKPGEAVRLLASSAQNASSLSKTKSKLPWGTGLAISKYLAKNGGKAKTNFDAAKQSMYGLSGIMGNPKLSQKVTTKGKK